MQDALVENLYLGLTVGAGTSTPVEVQAIREALVGEKALENPSMDLVAPGDLDGSYLWRKLSGDPNADPRLTAGCRVAATGPAPCSDCLPEAPCGVQMPLGGTIDPADACIVRNWILQGAEDN
jgi:hypothetical protein